MDTSLEHSLGIGKVAQYTVGVDVSIATLTFAMYLSFYLLHC